MAGHIAARHNGHIPRLGTIRPGACRGVITAIIRRFLIAVVIINTFAGQYTGHITTRDERHIATRRRADTAQAVLQIVSRTERARVSIEMVTLRVGPGVNVSRQGVGTDAAAARGDDISGADRNVLTRHQIDVARRRLY